MILKSLLRLIVFVTLIYHCPIVCGQTEESDKIAYNSLGFKSQYGFIIIHSKSIREIRDSYPWGLELDMNWHYNNKKSWEFCNCYPKLGFSGTYWDFDNPEILGHGFSSLFFVEPYFNHHRRLSFSIRAGFGLSYLSNPYEKNKNPNNQSYSTSVGFPLLLAFSLNYKINNNFLAHLSANYNHISNGGIKEPNKGINYPTLGIGIDHYFTKGSFPDRSRTDWKQIFGSDKRIELSVFGSMKQINHDEFERYAVYGTEIKGSKRVARISAITIGMEWLGDQSNREEIERFYTKDIDHNRGSIAIGHEFLLGKFIFSQQFGAYIYNPYKTDDDVYQRYGLIIRIGERISTGVNLKTHGHVADFIDLRIVYNILNQNGAD